MFGRFKRKEHEHAAEVRNGAEEDDLSSEDEELGGVPTSFRNAFSSRKPKSERKSSSFGKTGSKEEEPSDVEDEDLGTKGASKKKIERKPASFKSRKEKDDRDVKKQERKVFATPVQDTLTSKDLVIQVSKDDIEMQHKTLNFKEKIEYLSVSMYERTPLPGIRDIASYTGPVKDAVFEKGNIGDGGHGRVLVPSGSTARFGKGKRTKWREEVFQESVASGRFHRVFYDLNDLGERILDDKPRPEQEDHLPEYSPQKLRKMMDNIEYILEGIFMVAQGLLTGGSLFQLIVVLQISDPIALLNIYGPIASEVRRMFFFLSMLSFVGVCDKITAERNQKKRWNQRSHSERIEMHLYALLFFVCLVFSLLTWPLVDEIEGALESLETAPSVFAIGQSFQDTLEQWRVAVALRFAFAACGWLLVCKDTNRDLLRGRQRFVQIERFNKQLLAQNEKLAHHSGKMLDSVSVAELSQLQRNLSTGLHEVQLQLRIRGK